MSHLKVIRIIDFISYFTINKDHSDVCNVFTDFRIDILIPLLKKVNSKPGHVLRLDMSGYNRYGPTIIKYLFKHIHLDVGISIERLESILQIHHDYLKTVERMSWQVIKEN